MSNNAVKQNSDILSELQQKIFSIIISNLSEPMQNVSMDTLLSDLGMNSITFIKTIVNLEAAFEFEFDDEKLLITAFSNICSMVEYVESKIP